MEKFYFAIEGKERMNIADVFIVRSENFEQL